MLVRFPSGLMFLFCVKILYAVFSFLGGILRFLGDYSILMGILCFGYAICILLFWFGSVLLINDLES